MKFDAACNKAHLDEELQRLRGQAGQAQLLQARLETLERDNQALRGQLEERCQALETECRERCRTNDALHLAQVIIDHSPAILFRRIAGDTPRLVYVSPNIAMTGYTDEDFYQGRVQFKDVVHPDDHARVGREILDYASRQVEEYTQVYRILTRDGRVRWVEDRTSVVVDPRDGQRYNQGIVMDITRRKRAEDALRKSEEKHRRIVETASEGFVLMDENLRIVEVNDAYCRLVGYGRDELLGRTPLDFTTEDYRQFLLAHREELLDQDDRQFEGTMVAKDGRRIPLLIHGSTLRDDQGQVIGNMAFVTDMTEHKKALALAAEVQKSLLPQSGPQVQGLDVAGRNVSCDEIGGDYFDFIWRREAPQGAFSVAVGDITGHGVDSALLMTAARAFLRMRASQPGTAAEIIGAMNRQLAADVLNTGKFMTLFYLTIDLAADRLEWIRAGHEPGLLYDPRTDRFEELRGQGLPLGIEEGTAFHVNNRTGLFKGQVIAVGTDGIWEARNTEGRMFGKARFQSLIRRHHSGSAEEILGAVFQELSRHTRGLRTEDDITLVVVKITRDGERPAGNKR
jgi:sigma-B regulation protein RsbU (phosphoserine phosphatase)